MTIKDEDMRAAHEGLPTSIDEKQVDTTAELTCILNGVLIGAAVVLLLNNGEVKDQALEDNTVNYLKAYVANLVGQGLTRDAIGFLWSQMGVAAKVDESNNIQYIAYYLLGCTLEETSTAVKQS